MGTQNSVYDFGRKRAPDRASWTVAGRYAGQALGRVWTRTVIAMSSQSSVSWFRTKPGSHPSPRSTR